MKPILFVLPPENYREEEFWIPYQLLQEKGWPVYVASTTKLEIRGHEGRPVRAQYLLSEAQELDWQAVVFVGGEGSKQLWRSPQALHLAKRVYTRRGWVAAICYATLIPLLAEVLPCPKVTGYETIQPVLAQMGAQVVREGVVRDERLISASSPEWAEEFGRTLVECLQKGEDHS